MRRALKALILTTALGGFGGSTENTPPAGPPPSISIQVSPTQVLVVSGQASPSVTVTLTRIGASTSAVTLSVSGLPAGVRASFSPTQLTRGTTTATLDFQANPSTVPGNSNIKVQANGGGTLTAETTMVLTVRAAS